MIAKAGAVRIDKKASSPNRVGDFLSFLPDLYTEA
jgi:hypothetical protein